MNQMCQNCGFEVHVDDTQCPPYAFTVDCPRCRKSVTMTPAAKEAPSLKGDRTQMISSPGGGVKVPGGGGAPADMMQTFMQMMASMAAPKSGASTVGFSWARKHVLLCCAESSQRQLIEGSLDTTRYEMTAVATSAQAIEAMHDLKIEIILLDPQFDAARQGGIAVLRHVNSLMPKYRRRVYVVLVSPQVKTLDTYMAFLNCVNLTINSEDLESLPAILEKSVKDFNDLYRPFHEAGGSTPF